GRAEKQLGSAQSRQQQQMGGTSKDLQRLVHELQVHQVELEVQNEELVRTQQELEAARDRYADLYDFSPAGHVTLDGHGKIVEANYRATVLLDEPRTKLIGEPLARFISAADQPTFYRHCRMTITTGLRQSCEVELHKESNVPCCLHLESLAIQSELKGLGQWRTAMLDISDRKRIEGELEGKRQQLEAVIESAMDAIITVDERHRVVLFNKAAESMFGCTALAAMGGPLDRFIPQRLRASHQKHLNRFGSAVDEGSSLKLNTTVSSLIGLRADGKEFPLEASMSRVTVHGRPLFTVILRDVTERKTAEAAIRANNAFTTAIFDSLSAHVCALDRNGVILKVNEAWKSFSGHNSAGPMALAGVGDNYLDVCRRAIAGGERAVRRILKGIESVLSGSRSTFSTEYACHSPTEKRWFLMKVTKLLGSEAVVISHTDMSERIRMARALEDHVVRLAKQQTELESLAGKLIEAQETERKRIARELHDDYNQRLAALSLELESIEQAGAASTDPSLEKLKAIRGHVAQLSDDLHDLAYRLHPSLLEHVGLEVAVRDHIDEFTKRTGLPVQLVVARHMPEKLPLETATNFFRVMQEGLQNVSKHAAATQVLIKLSGSSRGIGLSVRDNGKGFEPKDVSAHIKGLGLLSMQERMRLLGGFLHIHSRPAKGTKICAWMAHGSKNV
ncbi:MAG TPA: PAS domain S-box protein, partial [Nitrospira sp.]|nr:PAS domain S-box protein [Nitrospira sp.]